MRVDGRTYDQLRNIEIKTGVLKYAEGSVYITIGGTQVLCAATIEEKVPPFLRHMGKGWITAEYSMLPRATQTRTIREASRGKLSGRTMEIQRLIGRVLRSVVDLKKLGERTIWIDCDVIQADGGTRTASITGAYVAMVMAIAKLVENRVLSVIPVTDFVAATSVGVLGERAALDLCYEEDSTANVDMNIVMTGSGKYIEIQGTGEESPFTAIQLTELLELGKKGTLKLIDAQKEALGELANRVK